MEAEEKGSSTSCSAKVSGDWNLREQGGECQCRWIRNHFADHWLLVHSMPRWRRVHRPFACGWVLPMRGRHPPWWRWAFPSFYVRYVGVIWFVFFMFFNFYRLDLHIETVLHLQIYYETTAKFELKIWPPLTWLLLLGVHFVVPLTEYIGPPNCVHDWVWSNFKFFWRCSSISSNSPITNYHSNIGVRISKVTENHPHTFCHCIAVQHYLCRLLGGSPFVVGSVVKLKLTLFHVRLLNIKPFSIIFSAELHKRAKMKNEQRTWTMH